MPVLRLRSTTVASSVDSGGVADHPVSGERVLATVLGGSSWELRRLRENSRATLLFRMGWD